MVPGQIHVNTLFHHPMAAAVEVCSAYLGGVEITIWEVCHDAWNEYVTLKHAQSDSICAAMLSGFRRCS